MVNDQIAYINFKLRYFYLDKKAKILFVIGTGTVGWRIQVQRDLILSGASSLTKVCWNLT
jgi:hypothetical protein